MMDYEKYTALAKDCGFTHCVPLDVSSLEFLQEVRDMCNPEQCSSYGKSWSCPPACPSIDEMRDRAAAYSDGLLLQTIGDLEDSYDWEGIRDASARHKENFTRLRNELEKNFAAVYPMGAGGCRLCESCTYPDEPCRYPDKMSMSMEASGLFVSKVCTDNNLSYNYGPDKIAFTSCFLINPA